MTRLLFIAHYFPPIGGAGVQRSVKFVKYLPSLGILPTVITGSGNSTGWWSPQDESLANEVPAEVRVYRVEELGSLRRSRVRQRGIVAAGQRAAREQGADVILVSMSPFADAHAAAELSCRLGIPWIADLRDPWALDEFQIHRSRYHRLRELRRMQRALQTAAMVVMNTPESAVQARRAFPSWSDKRVIEVTNGYDADDFADQDGPAVAEEFTIVHSGYLHTGDGLHQRRHAWQYRLLGRTVPGVELLARSHFYLLRALERWMQQDARVRERVRLLLIGKPSVVDEEEVRSSSASDLVRFTGYLSHRESLDYVRRASLLFLPMHAMPAGRRATIVPGKTYEYMASQRPILAAVPAGDAKDFLDAAGTGLTCDPNDVDAMLRILKTQFQAWAAREPTVRWNAAYVSQFERRRLAERLAMEILALRR